MIKNLQVTVIVAVMAILTASALVTIPAQVFADHGHEQDGHPPHHDQDHHGHHGLGISFAEAVVLSVDRR
jgi:Spy/CpxP family protein refolding chaperone